MKIIKPNASYLERDIHPYKTIERIGRTCYKSEDSITDDSAVRFVKAMAKNRHYAMLEHGHIYVKLDEYLTELIKNLAEDDNNMFKFVEITYFPHNSVIFGSFRAFKELVENYGDTGKSYAIKEIGKFLASIYPEIFTAEADTEVSDRIELITESDFKELVNALKISKAAKDEILKKNIVHSVHFICDRGVTHEFVRHRPASFAQESTRYCNYSKDKFGSEITVIHPFFFEEGSEEYKIWEESAKQCEIAYFKLIEKGRTPQEARDVLPAEVKTELFITASEAEWQHIINLRYHGTTGKPHPQMVEVMTMIYDTLVERSENRLQ